MKEIIDFLTWLNENDYVKNIIVKKESVYKESKSIDAKTFEDFVKKEIIPVAKANGFHFEAQDYFDFLNKNTSRVLSDEELEYVSGGKGLFIPIIFMSIMNVAQLGMNATTYAAPPTTSYVLSSHEDYKVPEHQTQQNVDFVKKELLKEFNSIGEESKWKLVMDGQFHEYDNPDLFDTGCDSQNNKVRNIIEPGYKDAMLSALDYTFSEECMNKKFDADLYLSIHEKACSNVFKNNYSDSKLSVDFRKAGEGVYFGLDEANFSIKGIEQHINKKNSSWKSDKLFVPKDYKATGYDSILGTLTPYAISSQERKYYAPGANKDDSIKKAVNLIFEEYYDKLQELDKNGYVDGSFLPEDASLEDKKLEIIIRICQNLDQLHAWEDGNIRTITFLVMQRMLIENGLTPAIFENPNYIDFKSVEEIIEELKSAQDIYIGIVEDEDTK